MSAYQYVLSPPSAARCNQTFYQAWRNDTHFDEYRFQGVQVGGCNWVNGRVGFLGRGASPACQARHLHEFRPAVQ